jgi:hypothetical protein
LPEQPDPADLAVAAAYYERWCEQIEALKARYREADSAQIRQKDGNPSGAGGA